MREEKNTLAVESAMTDDRRIQGFSYAVVVSIAALGILIAINQLFQLSIAGFMPIASGYYYYILATFLSISFLLFPGHS